MYEQEHYKKNIRLNDKNMRLIKLCDTIKGELCREIPLKEPNLSRNHDNGALTLKQNLSV